MKLICSVLVAIAIAASSASARVEVTIDAASLNELVGKMAPERIPVTLGMGRAVTIGLNDLKITGFEPAGGKNGNGRVSASVRLSVPELGLDTAVTPKLSLQFRDTNGKKVAYLRFEEVKVAMPVTGAIDIAALLPLLPISVDTAWNVESQRGEVRITPRLTDATGGQRNLRLGFDLDVKPVGAAAANDK